MFGTADSMIDSARAFRDAMIKAGNRCELDEYADLPHGFFNVGRNGNQEFFATLAKVDQFLTSLGYLKGEPTVRAFFEVR
jgi:acetyl esterase/lipase